MTNLVIDLKPAVLVEGRVTLDGKPVPGATMSIQKSKSEPISVGNATAVRAIPLERQTTITDREGIYRVAVESGENTTASLNVAPNLSIRPLISLGAKREPNGKYVVPTYELRTEQGEIAGRVIDQDGQPIEGARVSVRRMPGLEPSMWVGHVEESRSKTDSKGFFNLKHVPEGDFQLLVFGPSTPGARAAQTTKAASTGTTDLSITLATGPRASSNRLPVKKVPRQSGN